MSTHGPLFVILAAIVVVAVLIAAVIVHGQRKGYEWTGPKYGPKVTPAPARKPPVTLTATSNGLADQQSRAVTEAKR